jgi:hypothetical protein
MAPKDSQFKEFITPNGSTSKVIDDGNQKLLMARRLHFAWHMHTGLNYTWRLAWTKSGPINAALRHGWSR